MQNKKQIVYLKLSEITPYSKNPRKNDKSVPYVMESIKKFGFKQPIVVDKNYEIVCGHTRYLASRKLHLDTVPCIVADDLTDEEIRAYRLADNKVAEFAEWDFDLLSMEFESIVDIDMTDFGFELSEMEEETGNAVEDDDYEMEIPEEPKSKRGDVYLLGKNRLMCGDSTSIDDVEKLMGGQKADLLITDPPYNVDYTGKSKKALKIENDAMDNDTFHQFLCDVFRTAFAVMKDGASFYVWYASREHTNFDTSLKESGFDVKQQLIWEKNTLVMGRQDYQWKHEPCLYGWKVGASHTWYSDRKQTTVMHFDRPTKADIHPTMKPIPLFDYQIKNSSKSGDVILDLFNGSGTTIMACQQNGRIGYGMELDPRYVDATINRWEQFTGQKAVLLND